MDDACEQQHGAARQHAQHRAEEYRIAVRRARTAAHAARKALDHKAEVEERAWGQERKKARKIRALCTDARAALIHCTE